MTVSKQLTFPADPVLERLLAEARKAPDLEIVIDIDLKLTKTYSQLLGDVVKTRNDLLQQSTKVGIQPGAKDEANYIAIITSNGYEYIIAFLAIRAMGGTPMPLASGIIAEEAEYFFAKAQSTYILVGQNNRERTKRILGDLRSRSSIFSATALPISTLGDPVNPNDVTIDHTRVMKPDGPGLVLFTSGTTGPPKGAVLPRRLFAHVEAAQPGEATFNCRPGHWFGGTRSLLEPILKGQKVYILRELEVGRERSEGVLGIFRNYRITYAMFTPNMLRDMREVLLNGQEQLSDINRNYWHGRFCNLSRIRCATGVVEQSTRQFWTDLADCPFENNYGSTELGGGALAGLPMAQGSLGKPVNGVEVKLSEGDTGEIMVKSPHMLIGYLNDEKRTHEAFDKKGFFRTGDLAEKIHDEFVFCGRANSDFIRSGVFRIPAVDVESSLLDLPYISEVCVVGVPDNDERHLCAAVVRVQRGMNTKPQPVNLTLVRKDLEARLAPFMLPRLFYVLKDDESLPLTVSGKVIRREALRQFFGATGGILTKELPLDVECWKGSTGASAKAKAWDYCGLQYRS